MSTESGCLQWIAKEAARLINRDAMLQKKLHSISMAVSRADV
jgi:hypothetical protein